VGVQLERQALPSAQVGINRIPIALRGEIPAWVPTRWLPGPAASDVLAAAAVAALSILSGILAPGRFREPLIIWDLALAAPLILRRRRPAQVLAFVSAVCFVQWLADVITAGDVAFLVALFSVGAYERRWWTQGGAIAVAVLGIVLAFLRWAPTHDWLVSALTAAGAVSACWIVGIYMRMRRDYIDSIRERAETAERERDSKAQVAVVSERARIAREMHDVIAHSLSVMITLNDAAAATDPSSTARSTIIQASEVGRQALEDMGRLLGVLREDDVSGHEPQPGLEQVHDLLSTVRASGLVVELAVVGDLGEIPATAQLALFRIVQEGLTNVLKHASNVQAVQVELRRDGDAVRFRVDDDGAPAAQQGQSRLGHGLSGMDERVRMFNGELTAGPGEVSGWSLRGVLQLDEVTR
jgi:signal transduction histidine kinase